MMSRHGSEDAGKYEIADEGLSIIYKQVINQRARYWPNYPRLLSFQQSMINITNLQ